jgi:hypothetical protein
MSLQSIILSEVRLRRPKAACSFSYAVIDLKQMQQCYGTWVLIGGGHAQEGQGKGRKQKT